MKVATVLWANYNKMLNIIILVNEFGIKLMNK